MSWLKVYPSVVAVACVLIIIANTPAILTDNLVTAVAQIRANTAKTVPLSVPSSDTEIPYPEVTPAAKKAK